MDQRFDVIGWHEEGIYEELHMIVKSRDRRISNNIKHDREQI